VLGGLAERGEPGKIVPLGIALSIGGSLLVVLTPAKHGRCATTMMARQDRAGTH
jgi:hypothetical protein